MCSVIGCYLESPTEAQVDTLKRVFLESKIRGRHATGMSFLMSDSIQTYKEPISADKFIESEDFLRIVPGDYTLQLIGHTRYSTSDLRYNQPIQVQVDTAIAHNGVVDQRHPEHWLEYGYTLETANDSELIYHTTRSGQEPLNRFPEASMAVVELSISKGLRWYRNSKRPLYQVKTENGWFICSTLDIAKRAGLKGAERCLPGTVYTPTSQTSVRTIEEMIP